MAPAKLTPFARLLIVLLIVAGLFFGFRYLTQQGIINLGNLQTENPDLGREKPEGQKQVNNIKPNTKDNAFNYTPKAPVNGSLKGVVELGAAGFNSFVVEIDTHSERPGHCFGSPTEMRQIHT